MTSLLRILDALLTALAVVFGLRQDPSAVPVPIPVRIRED